MYFIIRSAIEKPLKTVPSMRGAVHQSPQAPIARVLDEQRILADRIDRHGVFPAVHRGRGRFARLDIGRLPEGIEQRVHDAAAKLAA